MMSLAKNTHFLATLKAHSEPPLSQIQSKPLFLFRNSDLKIGGGVPYLSQSPGCVREEGVGCKLVPKRKHPHQSCPLYKPTIVSTRCEDSYIQYGRRGICTTQYGADLGEAEPSVPKVGS